MRRALLAVIISTMSLACWCQTRIIAGAMEMTPPNATKYLPGPPDSLSMHFTHDVHRYMYGKTLRLTERGTQARNDVTYGVLAVAARMSDAFGTQVNHATTPRLIELLTTAVNFVSLQCGAAKSYYNRRRPFDRFNDPIFSTENRETLKRQGSYPSAHSMLGWTVALVLQEVNPKVQDQLLYHGYEYGESRVIVGAHWQSDIDDARMMAVTGFARLHSDETYLQQLKLAQEEYDQITHNQRSTSLDAMHPVIQFLPEMPDSTSGLNAHDYITHYQQKSLRPTERGAQAISDADVSITGLSQAFSSILGLTIDATLTPAIVQLLEAAIPVIERNCLNAKEQSFRTRPFALLGEASHTSENIELLRQQSSYPSLHATLGWTAALLLSDVCPSYQNEILLRGREYGQSRVIAGTNWQSDVNAGQLLGGMIFANLVSDLDFCNLISLARQEYNSLSSLEQIGANPQPGHSQSYTIDGRKATGESIGVIVSTDGRIIVR